MILKKRVDGIEFMIVYAIESEQESDGRWLAENKDLPGVIVYGRTKEKAIEKAIALSLRVLADQIEANGLAWKEWLEKPIEESKQ